jgi:hypothetical protein
MPLADLIKDLELDWQMTATGLLCLYAILPDDRQLYDVEQLFNNRRFGNLELAESANSGRRNSSVREAKSRDQGQMSQREPVVPERISDTMIAVKLAVMCPLLHFPDPATSKASRAQGLQCLESRWPG